MQPGARSSPFGVSNGWIKSRDNNRGRPERWPLFFSARSNDACFVVAPAYRKPQELALSDRVNRIEGGRGRRPVYVRTASGSCRENNPVGQTTVGRFVPRPSVQAQQIAIKPTPQKRVVGL